MGVKQAWDNFVAEILFVVYVEMLVLAELYWTIFPSKRPDKTESWWY